MAHNYYSTIHLISSGYAFKLEAKSSYWLPTQVTCKRIHVLDLACMIQWLIYVQLVNHSVREIKLVTCNQHASKEGLLAENVMFTKFHTRILLRNRGICSSCRQCQRKSASRVQVLLICVD